MAKKLILEKDGNFIRIGKKWFMFAPNLDGDFRTGEHRLVEVNKIAFDKKVKEITENLFSFVDPKLVMKDALKDLLPEELDKILAHIRKRKRKKRKPKVDIVKHCIQMKVAGVEIPIR